MENRNLYKPTTPWIFALKKEQGKLTEWTDKRFEVLNSSSLYSLNIMDVLQYRGRFTKFPGIGKYGAILADEFCDAVTGTKWVPPSILLDYSPFVTDINVAEIDKWVDKLPIRGQWSKVGYNLNLTLLTLPIIPTMWEEDQVEPYLQYVETVQSVVRHRVYDKAKGNLLSVRIDTPFLWADTPVTGANKFWKHADKLDGIISSFELGLPYGCYKPGVPYCYVDTVELLRKD